MNRPVIYYKATIRDRAEDALAAFRFLESRAEVDPKRIGSIGNSEGRGSFSSCFKLVRVAFVVMLAAPGWSSNLRDGKLATNNIFVGGEPEEQTKNGTMLIEKHPPCQVVIGPGII